MADIKNPEAYFKTTVRNSYKDEFRANDNFFKHVSSVGDITDIPNEYNGNNGVYSDCSIEIQLNESSLENWLLFMDSESLHNALKSLPSAQLTFLFELAAFDFDKTEYAKAKGITQQAVSDRFNRIIKKIRKFF